MFWYPKNVCVVKTDLHYISSKILKCLLWVTSRKTPSSDPLRPQSCSYSAIPLCFLFVHITSFYLKHISTAYTHIIWSYMYRLRTHGFIHFWNHSFKKYLLSTYYVPRPILKKVGTVGIRQSWFPGIYILWGKVKVLVAQSRPTLCDPMDGRPPGSSEHGILQARMLQWRLTINECKLTPVI